ncbi:hypothetical protein ACQEVB_39675 [Pseudonocardia sp. CA-107938]|uniref:hypothetical protein n=1 Tax=Pseudonocardia sp. CA-107938 TaxID=3240021 RepID=UPI003D938CFD
MTVTEIELDDAVLERLASIICGDDGPFYRRGFEIVKFFRAAGWSVPDEVDVARRAWTIARLLEGKDDGVAMARLVLRLADRREYLGEDTAHTRVLDDLNALLQIEGYAIVTERGRPKLVEDEQELGRMAAPIELTASVSQIVSDKEFGEQLSRRLDEAHRCWQSAAPTAAIVMLGSVLEGVLYDVAISRHDSGKVPTDHLESLINMAGENRWIAKDVVDYAHVLRDHRNLVHPKKQWKQAYAPEGDTVDIAWRVVVAALNDLAELGPPLQR